MCASRENWTTFIADDFKNKRKVEEIKMMTSEEFIVKQHRDDNNYLLNRKKDGKYMISIYRWKYTGKKDKHVKGDFVASCFVDNGTDLSVIYHLFRGFFYVLSDTKTRKILRKGSFDDELFDEMVDIEGDEWEYVSSDELPLDFIKRKEEREKEEKIFYAYLKVATAIDDAIEVINSISDDCVGYEQICTGWDNNIETLISLSKKSKNNN